jgi:hypothetical protein
LFAYCHDLVARPIWEHLEDDRGPCSHCRANTFGLLGTAVEPPELLDVWPALRLHRISKSDKKA